MKKLLSLVLSFAMVICYNITAFATSKGSITISNNPKSTGITLSKVLDEYDNLVREAHEFKAYKIFDLVLNPNDNEKGSYTLNGEFEELFRNDSEFIKFIEDEKEKTLSDLIDLSEFAVEFISEKTPEQMTDLATTIKDFVEKNKITADASSNEVTVDNEGIETVTLTVDTGYYIVIDTVETGTDGKEGAVSAVFLQNTKEDPDVTVNLKGSQPDVDKEILHNDTGEWGPVGDNQIGDTVYFRLLAKLPSDITGYTKYTYILGDTMDKGLTFNNNIEVKDAEGEEIDAKYYEIISVEEKVDEEGELVETKFELSINVMKLYEDGVVPQGSVLTVEYSAILNENAVMAPQSNDNRVDLEYSNDPYDSESTDKTPEVVVKDYTFEIEATKTAEVEDGELLPGVEFELSNKDGEVLFTEFTLDDGTNVYTVAKEGTATIVTGTNGKFKIIGLDDAVEYTLKETKPLDGYNKIDDIVFTITATYNEDGTVNELTTDNESFGLSSIIVNTSGALLPETGGIGTTIFTVAGGALMIGSVAVMISKRRSSK
ncbi:MAG: isopeptide-forming domain-containing fimbrial protein [Peptostreptococcaceae bacterium]